MGNGFPMGAVVTTPEIANSFTKASYFNTFGGNPMAATVGKAVLEVGFTFYPVDFVLSGLFRLEFLSHFRVYSS